MLCVQPYRKYTAADISLLHSDSDKLERFVGVTRDCLVPLYLYFDEIYKVTNHLCEFPAPSEAFGQLPLGLDFEDLLRGSSE